jgi:hypothetical protein
MLLSNQYITKRKINTNDLRHKHKIIIPRENIFSVTKMGFQGGPNINGEPVVPSPRSCPGFCPTLRLTTGPDME